MSRVRSPNYPNISLKDAIERVRKVQELEGQNDIDRTSFVEILGYSGLTGPSSQLLSSLSKFGLIEKVGAGEVKISNCAMDILFGESSERAKALHLAANSPALYAEINAKWPDRVPSDENLRSYLARQGFSMKALDNVINAFKETMEYVKFETSNDPIFSERFENSGGISAPVPLISGSGNIEKREVISARGAKEAKGFDVGFDGNSIRLSGVIASKAEGEKVVSTITALLNLLPVEEEEQQPPTA